MAKSKVKFYAVYAGRNPGVYTQWEGDGGAAAQVREYPGARYKSFSSRSEALEWINRGGEPNGGASAPEHSASPEASVAKKASNKAKKGNITGKTAELPQELLAAGKVVIYTDGSCLNNPGPGGFAAVLLFGEKRREISSGFRLTTNNRMELTAAVEALAALKRPCSVVLYSDSQYMIKAVTLGWAQRWRANGWMRKEGPPENVDLWKKLMAALEVHEVEFRWVKGHAGNPENERCDELARQAASATEPLPIDAPYESAHNKD